MAIAPMTANTVFMRSAVGNWMDGEEGAEIVAVAEERGSAADTAGLAEGGDGGGTCAATG